MRVQYRPISGCLPLKSTEIAANQVKLLCRFLKEISNTMTMPSTADTGSLEPAHPQAQASSEVRCAVRFPLSLPLVIATDTTEFPARTIDVSASGVCFITQHRFEPGQWIHFSLRMPGHVLATSHDVLVHCHGRVVRCTASQDDFHTAATIDEYNFAEQ